MTKLVTLVAIIVLFLLFFRARNTFLRWVLAHALGNFTFFIVRLVVAFTTGYVIYASIAVLSSAGRLSSIDDVFTILLARPSQVGGLGILGAVIGFMFAATSYLNWNPYANSSIQQGRTIHYGTFRRQVSIIGMLREFLRKGRRK